MTSSSILQGQGEQCQAEPAIAPRLPWLCASVACSGLNVKVRTTRRHFNVSNPGCTSENHRSVVGSSGVGTVCVHCPYQPETLRVFSATESSTEIGPSMVQEGNDGNTKLTPVCLSRRTGDLICHSCAADHVLSGSLPTWSRTKQQQRRHCLDDSMDSTTSPAVS